MSFSKERTSVNLGDVLISNDRNSGAKKTVSKDGQDLDSFSLQVYIPDDIDQAKIGQPSLILTKGQYVNFRVPSDKEVASAPDWKRPLMQLKAWISLGTKK